MFLLIATLTSSHRHHGCLPAVCFYVLVESQRAVCQTYLAPSLRGTLHCEPTLEKTCFACFIFERFGRYSRLISINKILAKERYC